MNKNDGMSTDVLQKDTVNFSHLGNYLNRSIEYYKRECHGLTSRELTASLHITTKTLSNVKKGFN